MPRTILILYQRICSHDIIDREVNHLLAFEQHHMVLPRSNVLFDSVGILARVAFGVRRDLFDHLEDKCGVGWFYGRSREDSPELVAALYGDSRR